MHEIQHRKYDYKQKKADITNELNKIVEHETYKEGGGGLVKDIRWYDLKLNNYADAVEFIEKQDKGWYDQLAVSFKDYSKTQDSKEICKLREKCNQKEKELYELIIKPHFIACKSKFVSCKNCESKISTKYLININYCAVCRADLRPQTLIQTISNKQKAITLLHEKINHKRNELETKGKYDLKWLVKIEYHV